MIYALLWLMVFVNGMAIGAVLTYLFLRRGKVEVPAVEPATAAEGPSSEELERARREREELIASQKAFQAMMGYNADIAYGIASDDDITAGGS